MMDWKILIAVFVGLLLIAGSMANKIGLSDFVQEISEKIKDIINFGGNLAGKALPVDRNISVVGNFELKDFKMEKNHIGEITLNYEGSKEISISEQKLKTENPTNLTIIGFDGVFAVNSTPFTISMDGNANKVLVNSIELQSTKATFPVKIKNLEVNKVSLHKVDIQNLKLENFKGNVNLEDKANIKINKEPLEIEAFLGNIQFSKNNMGLDGLIKRFYMHSENFEVSVT